MSWLCADQSLERISGAAGRNFSSSFARQKSSAGDWIRSVPSLIMAWKNQYLDEERALFEGRDPWAYGLKANFAALTKFLSYCDAQGISARSITPYDLFAPSTWELSE